MGAAFVSYIFFFYFSLLALGVGRSFNILDHVIVTVAVTVVYTTCISICILYKVSKVRLAI